MKINKKTRIVCTLGPASNSCSELERMIDAGMNVARLNFSHGSYAQMESIISNLKKASQKTKKSIALLQDLQGPKIRLGHLPKEGVSIERSELIILSTTQESYEKKKSPSPKIIPVQYKNLHEDVHVGDVLLIDDGYIEVKVTKKRNGQIFCKVSARGILKSHKGINCPTASIQAKTITEKDRADLIFGLKHEVDYVALSFVKSEKDIMELRKLIDKNKQKEVQIIAKIERHEAIENLKAIANAADGLMVARGDLGIEIPAEQVPIVQKEIVRLGLHHAKPVIIATQILESMIQNPRATRAEVSDAATAIFDHADAFMLSGETSVGKYPIQAIQTLNRVARVTEKEIEKRDDLITHPLYDSNIPISDATCTTATLIAEEIKAHAILIMTRSGYTARQIMKHRPRTMVIAVTPNEHVLRQLQLVWGIQDVLLEKNGMPFNASTDEAMLEWIRKKVHSKQGQKWVIVNASKEKSVIRTIVV